MSSPQDKPRRRGGIRILIGAAAVLLVLAAALAIYLRPYPAGTKAVQAMIPSEDVTITQEDGVLRFEPTANFIFYPGGLVQPESYAVLARTLAANGVNTYIIAMPLNLAVLDAQGANRVLPLLDPRGINIIGGHSLGGTMAAEYVMNSTLSVQGIVFLASYPNRNIRQLNIPVLSVYGSQDGVLDMERYTNSKSYMPDSFEEHVIKGGNHAQFGDYGLQKKDKGATISDDQQVRETVSTIVDWIATLHASGT
ncbi:alpha/beta hydrolase [Paenibacillus popilliae]|uniref:Predicted hydrolase/acyltransferase n=1 Tax=Paenibacillus popilliae ATCC 14706 TaxID=1212764 RepID=M9LIK8_PAEPP|nr:alpha/beta hydrolase [Paenibacillus popilliae]GAC42970.1 predicted hydrolase/acyltransferase [Paenibacillus popilliae ATCC 14706]